MTCYDARISDSLCSPSVVLYFLIRAQIDYLLCHHSPFNRGHRTMHSWVSRGGGGERERSRYRSVKIVA